MYNIIVADLETNSLNPDTIWMAGILDFHTNEFFDYNGENLVDGLIRMAEADVLITFNGYGYDLPVVEKLTEGLITFEKERHIDVLKLSRKFADLPDHKLKRWGDMFGMPKGDHTDFSKYSPEMSKYCQRDCRITKEAFVFLNELSVEKGNTCLLKEIRRQL